MLISLFVMVLSIATDQFTKHLTLLHLKDKAPVSLIDGVLELHFIPIPALPGACWKDSFFHCLYGNCIFIRYAVLCVKTARTEKFHILYILSGLLAGGALGNMIDRIRLGYVVDFIYFSLDKLSCV